MAELTQTFEWSPLFAGAQGAETAEVTSLHGGGVVAQGKIINNGSENKAHYMIQYRILLDNEWNTQSVIVLNVTTGQTLVLYTDGAGHWLDENGTKLPALTQCRDIDIPESVLMKTFPIRRLKLEAWARCKTRSASVFVTASTLHVDLQTHRYSCYDDDWMLFRYDGGISGISTEFFTDKGCFVNKFIEGWSFTACYHTWQRDWESPSEHPTLPPRTKRLSIMGGVEDTLEYSDIGSDHEYRESAGVILDDNIEYEDIDGD
ncbi:putative glycolipid-binding-domain-containing protein [Aspergillus pseudoustus]|uniref:Glycolipid-binding-domain-containing protein n=1 Tax=Aspergillus pseudoustus TaxID=1810923 RepID=A0ABR4KSP1_9EURO